MLTTRGEATAREAGDIFAPREIQLISLSTDYRPKMVTLAKPSPGNILSRYFRTVTEGRKRDSCHIQRSAAAVM
jgi:hypothetical protein